MTRKIQTHDKVEVATNKMFDNRTSGEREVIDIMGGLLFINQNLYSHIKP